MNCKRLIEVPITKGSIFSANNTHLIYDSVYYTITTIILLVAHVVVTNYLLPYIFV